MKRTNIILFSYDFHPSHMVSSHRVTYWAKHLKESLTPEHKLHIITCNENAKLLDTIDSLSFISKKTHKLTQIINLYRKLRALTEPSIIIITAGPFYFLASLLFLSKKHKIVIDLRDPFSNDPKHKVHPLKRKLKHIFEKAFIYKADLIISINQNLLDEFPIPTTKMTAIVPNGLDEDFSPNLIKPLDSHNAIITGKVYEDLTPYMTLIEKLNPDMTFTQYISSDMPLKNKLPKRANVIIKPSIEKDKIQEEISRFSIGIISTYPKAYVLPVKIFDYVQVGLKIIVINDSKDQNTEIKRFLKNYHHVCYLYPDDISSKAYTFIPSEKSYYPAKEYFRSHSTREFAKRLQEL